MLPEKIQSRIGKRSDFCGKIVNTRNYLTHYDDSVTSSALSAGYMMQYEYILIAVCKVLFLLETGVPSELITQKMGDFHVPEIFNYNSQEEGLES